jgi:ribonuclease R
VHDAPPPDKLENFVKIANRFGYELNTNNNKTISASFNTLLENLEGKPEKNMMESLAIRTMSKAFYTTKKGGHYGLAFDYYTHFTSPIRRYPDVIAHRLLQQYLIGQYDDVKQEAIEKLCKHSSEMEIRAEEAERASIQFKQIEYMTQFIGDEFEAIISGVTDSTLFVEITENKCEGRIPLSSLIDDYYFFEGENYLLRGVNTGKVFQLGDEAKIRVMEADPVRRKLIFDMV